MNELTEFLIDNYYKNGSGGDSWDPSVIDHFVNLYQDRMIGKRDPDGNIYAAAVFLKLSDQALTWIRDMGVRDVFSLNGYFCEDGPNLHVILVVANGYAQIMDGLRDILDLDQFKTVSWFDPDGKWVQYDVQ